uniref:Meiosis-specific nuclear structural protein 1 n=1 Tax=Ailuropoda melanoleuca TaxID=9646 RepID=A0A7N5KFT6_AILME
MASKRRTLSFSERHQKLVDRNYCKQLHVQSVRKIQNQIRDQMVQNENDDLVERKRFLRLLQNEQFELDMEEAIQKAEENKRLRELQLEQEEKLAVELAKLKHESLKDEKMRQQVRENRERQQKLEKMNVTRRYIEEFQKEQALWRKKKREEMEEENRKIIEFANMQQQREEDRMAKVQENEEKRLQLQNTLTQKLEEMLRQREDLEQVRQELYQEEQAEIHKMKLKEEAEEKLRKQKELRQNFIEQMALKELVLQAAKEEEETFRKAMLAKLAEDDRIELMNAQKQRMKQLEHRRAVEKLIEERRNQFLADKQRELEEWQLQQRRQGCINAIIEEERLKLLKEHATKLLGYLPKGVFKKEDDIDMLGEEFRKAYQKRSEIC